MPGEQEAHGNAGSAKPALGRSPALHSPHAVGQLSLGSPCEQQMHPLPWGQGEMQLLEEPHHAGGEAWTWFWGNALPRAGCEGLGLSWGWCCQPWAACPGDRNHLQPVPCSKRAPRDVVSDGSWKTHGRNPAAGSGPITAPSCGDNCKQNNGDGRLARGSPDSRELTATHPHPREPHYSLLPSHLSPGCSRAIRAGNEGKFPTLR